MSATDQLATTTIYAARNKTHEVLFASKKAADDYATRCSPAAGVVVEAREVVGDGTPRLQVWFGSMPESNGKTNWTAILHRGDLTKDPTLAGEYVLVYKKEDAPLLVLLERGDTLSLNEITGFRQFHTFREAQMAAENLPATMPTLEPMQVKDYLQTVLDVKSKVLSNLE